MSHSDLVLPCLLVLGVTWGAAAQDGTQVHSLDGPWLIAVDSKNVGREQSWWRGPQPGAKAIHLPNIIQDAFPEYHGVAWFWREFDAPGARHDYARFYLRFWAVSYRADVWLNGKYLGSHEGADTPFTLDATDAIRAERKNQLAVRVLDPGPTEIDGYVRGQTPGGNVFPHGGFEDSIDLLVTGPVRIADLFVKPRFDSGIIEIAATVDNSLPETLEAELEFSVAPARSGETTHAEKFSCKLTAGKNTIGAQIAMDERRLWSLSDPFLYRVTARIVVQNPHSSHETSTRCGFRDFRVEEGYFKLNRKRIFLKSSHTGNECPIGIRVAHDPDLLRRDLINVKAMGFNCIRFFQALGLRYQLDLCDEIGLMAIQEPRGGWLYNSSPQMTDRYTQSITEMITRDRNHPCIVAWGLLNEHPWATGDSELFRHTVGLLPKLRSLDDSRLIFLNSGRWDAQPGIGSVSNPRSFEWDRLLGIEEAGAEPIKPYCGPGGPPYNEPGASPYAGYIGPLGDIHIYPRWPHTAETLKFLRSVGADTKHVFVSEYGVASAVDLLRLSRHYEQRQATHANFARYYRKWLTPFLADWDRWQLAECFGRPEDYFTACLREMAERRYVSVNTLRANPHVIGYSLTGTVDQGQTGEGLTTQFRELKPGTVDALADAFAPLHWCLFAEPVHVYRGDGVQLDAVLANEDVLTPGEYPVRIEVFGGDASKVFEKRASVVIGDPNTTPPPSMATTVFSDEVSADWPGGKYRLTATFERGAAATGRDAVFYVAERIKESATALRAAGEVVLWGDDPVVRDWLTEQGVPLARAVETAQSRREVIVVGQKPPAPGDETVFGDLIRRVARGATAVFLTSDVFARQLAPHTVVPAVYAYQVPGTDVELFGEPGERGPLRGLIGYNDSDGDLQVGVPHGMHTLCLGGRQSPAVVRWCSPVAGSVQIEGVFTAGNRATATVTITRNRSEKLFSDSGVEDMRFSVSGEVTVGDVIVFALRETTDVATSHTGLDVTIRAGDGQTWNLNKDAAVAQSNKPNEPGSRTGSSFGPWSYGFAAAEGKRDPLGWLPLQRKGTPISRFETSFVYPKDIWAKRHPIFAGLPTGGLLDYTYYRELFSDELVMGQEVPLESVAGAIVTSRKYYSGMRIGIYPLGAGRFVLNSFRIRENLGKHPAADRLLLNMLNFAGRDLSKPLAALPKDFAAHLHAIGYAGSTHE